MIIRSSGVSLSSAQASLTRTTTTATLRTWGPSSSPTTPRPATVAGGDAESGTESAGRALALARSGAGWQTPGPSAADAARSPHPRTGPAQALSVHALPAHTGQPVSADDGREALEKAGDHPGRLAIMIAIVEWLTGEPVQVLDPAEVSGSSTGTAAPVSAGAGTAGARNAGTAPAEAGGFGAELTVTESVEQSQAVRFAAEGAVVTDDGRQIEFDVDLQLYREAAFSRTTRLTAGAPEVKDPLVLSFGTTPGLSGQSVELDLEADGTVEQVPFVSAGNAYLVLDADSDGVVDDGRELFGPSTGDGFAELAAHDSDGNGWIDEADPVFSRLRLWSDPAAPLATLAERGVGAIGLARVATPFDLAAGDAAAQLHSTGVWLAENGTVGTVHRIDVVT